MKSKANLAIESDGKHVGELSTSGKKEQVIIPAPKMNVAAFRIRGITIHVQHKFSEKALRQMREAQEAGSRSKKGKQREARDFDADYRNATYVAPDGSYGIPCTAFRNALISACRLVDFKMTRAKLSLFVLADTYDGTKALVKITKGKPKPTGPMPVRNESGVIDLRNRPYWDIGWEAIVRIQYDESQFSVTDVANLLARAGLQVGVGEGRPDSKDSAGMDWGRFEVCGE